MGRVADKPNDRSSDLLYTRDYVAWVEDQARRLRAGEWSHVDADHLAEEIEDMGKRERRALRSQLRRVLVHLLKWACQPEARSSGGVGTINEARARIADQIEDSPSLRELVDETLEPQYARAREMAAREMGVDAGALPEKAPFEAEQVLSPQYWPEPGDATPPSSKG